MRVRKGVSELACSSGCCLRCKRAIPEVSIHSWDAGQAFEACSTSEVLSGFDVAWDSKARDGARNKDARGARAGYGTVAKFALGGTVTNFKIF